MENSLIKWIQQWYISQCDGDWEYEFGVKIQTLDNPGWNIKIDIVNLEFNKNIAWKIIENSNNDWFGYKIHDNYFEASGDYHKLEFILQLFKDFIEKGEKSLP
jgi:hypothetical protein